MLSVPDAIALAGVGFSYSRTEVPVFTDVTLRVPPGARLVLVGANGAGKSTLLRVAAGEWPLLAGEVARNCDVRPFFLTQDATITS